MTPDEWEDIRQSQKNFNKAIRWGLVISIPLWLLIFYIGWRILS